MTHFFSCDWGTTSFRLRHVDAATGELLAQSQATCGVRELYGKCAAGEAEEAFAGFLREQLFLMVGNDLAALEGVPVIISGMASSSVGWRELPYALLPLGLDGAGIQQVAFEIDWSAGLRGRIHLISGVRAEADIMRGEETEILGIFADGRYARIAEDGVVVLPGTHSKHVRLEHRQLTGFHTYMTGELFDVLAAHSLLRASVRTADGVLSAPLSDAASGEAFAAGVHAVVGGALARSLFQTRVRTVLQSVPPSVNRWFLSGLLIGSELADLAARNEAPAILLAAAEPLNAAYILAFEILGLRKILTVIPPEEMALASVRGHRVLLQARAKPGLQSVQ